MKRISLRDPSQVPSSEVSSSHPSAVYQHLRPASNPPSNMLLHSENGIDGAEEEDNDTHEIIMCIDMRDRGTVGCCYYESLTGSLHLVEDIRYGGLEVIETRALRQVDNLYKRLNRG